MDLSRDVVFGHEFCCEVLDYGPGTARKLKPGTQSVLAAGAADGRRARRASAIPTTMSAPMPSACCSASPCCWKSQWPAARACRADRAARRRRSCGSQGQYQWRRGAAGDRLRPGRACRDRRAQDQGPAPDRRGGLFAGAAGARREAGRRHRGRSRALATLRDLGRARRRCRRRRRRRVRRCRRCCRR